MSDVVLVVPPHDLLYADMGFAADRLGVGYLAATLRQAGFTVSVLHCPALRLDAQAAAEAILRQRPALVGISALFSETDMVGMVQVARAVWEHAPGLHLTVGGHPPSLTAGEVLTHFPEIDSVIRAEGEHTLLELASRLKQGRAWQDVAGMSCRLNGGVIHNPLRPLIDDLDQLPFPARDVLDLIPADQATVAMISSSRGCFGRCTFCSIRAFYSQAPGRLWRARSAENVVAEIETLRRRWPISSIQFVDDNFTGTGQRGRQRAYALAEALIRRKLRLRFSIESRADGVDETLFAALQRAGLATVFLGIESGTQRALDFFNKGTTVETNRRAIDVLRRLGIKCVAGFIPFDPYTTPAELLQNLRFLEETGLDQDLDTYPRFLNRLQVYPGCPVQKTLSERDLLEPVHDDRLRGYVNSYRFPFVDPRTAALFEALSAAGYSEDGRFLISSDFLHLRDRWRLWLKRIQHLTGLSEAELCQVPALRGPFITRTLEPWLKARWAQTMQTFMAMLEALSGQGPAPPTAQDLPARLRGQMTAALAEVDGRYLGMPLADKLNELQSLLVQPRISFSYRDADYIALFERGV